jgi:hypothetical protein
MISAGRVLIKPRGEWNAETTYHMLDLVNHKGYAYLAKRTVVGIEPSDDYPEYWHNMLDINKIVAEAMAETLASEVSELLKDDLSEARYVTDLLAEVDVPTFVHWNSETANTPFTEGLTTITHGYALVEDATVTAWAGGEEFTYSEFGWDKTIMASGGTMSGPLGLGGGKGSVSADDDGAFLEAKSEDDFKRIKVKNDSLEESVKFETKEKDYNLFGEHNPDKIGEMGYAKVYFGTYEGAGTCGPKNPSSLTFPFEPKMVIISGTRMTATMVNGQTELNVVGQASTTIHTINMTWTGKTVSWNSKAQTDAEDSQMNESGRTYSYIALG